MEFKKNGYRAGGNEEWLDDAPAGDEAEAFAAKTRKHLEPWLSAMFQSEHLNLLLGSGFTIAVAGLAKAPATGMEATGLGIAFDAAMEKHARTQRNPWAGESPTLKIRSGPPWPFLKGWPWRVARKSVENSGPPWGRG